MSLATIESLMTYEPSRKSFRMMLKIMKSLQGDELDEALRLIGAGHDSVGSYEANYLPH